MHPDTVALEDHGPGKQQHVYYSKFHAIDVHARTHARTQTNKDAVGFKAKWPPSRAQGWHVCYACHGVGLVWT